MQQPESEESFKIIEVIEVTGLVDKVVCLIGTCSQGTTVVRMETHRGNDLVYEEVFRFDPTFSMAELIVSLEEELRKDAQAAGSRIEIFENA